MQVSRQARDRYSCSPHTASTAWNWLSCFSCLSKRRFMFVELKPSEEWSALTFDYRRRRCADGEFCDVDLVTGRRTLFNCVVLTRVRVVDHNLGVLLRRCCTHIKGSQVNSLRYADTNKKRASTRRSPSDLWEVDACGPSSPSSQSPSSSNSLSPDSMHVAFLQFSGSQQ